VASLAVCAAVQTLAHTAMVVAAMTSHGEVVAWCTANTTARPWIVAKTLLCERCGTVTLSHLCRGKYHFSMLGVETTALLAACRAGDLTLVRGLVEQHAECEAGLRDGAILDGVCVSRVAWTCIATGTPGALRSVGHASLSLNGSSRAPTVAVM
jgi:hypothetical protein